MIWRKSPTYIFALKNLVEATIAETCRTKMRIINCLKDSETIGVKSMKIEMQNFGYEKQKLTKYKHTRKVMQSAQLQKVRWFATKRRTNVMCKMFLKSSIKIHDIEPSILKLIKYN